MPARRPRPRLPDPAALLVLAGLAGAPLLFLPGALGSFALPKATLVAVLAVAAAAVWVVRGVRDGHVVLPAGAFTYAAAAFLAAAALATVLSEQPVQSLVGAYLRNTGFVAYAALAVLALATQAFFDAAALRIVAATVVAPGPVVAAYGAAERAGWDPFGFGAHEGLAASTMGNPNFASGYLGIALAVAAGLALVARTRRGRLWAAGAAAASLPGLWAAGSRQGYVAAVAGLAFVAVMALRAVETRWRRVGYTTVAAAGAGAFAVLAVGILARERLPRGIALRGHYFQAAFEMVRDHPVLGIGFDMYGAFFRSYRSVEAALAVRLESIADNSHNVVLTMFVNGGVLLGLAYLTVLGVTAWALVSGLRRGDRARAAVLIPLGAGWIAYQVQALVSMDMTQLALVHWVFAGGIVLMGLPPRAVGVTLPTVDRPNRTKRQRRPSRARLNGLGYVAVIVAVVLSLTAAWTVTRPLRADLAAGRGAALHLLGESEEAYKVLSRAVELAPWERRYLHERGRVLLESGNETFAQADFAAAAAIAPRDLAPLITSARTAVLLGDVELAEEWYARAREVEPLHPELRGEIAELYLDLGRTDEARRLIEEIQAMRPDRRLLDPLLRRLEGS